MLLIVVVKKIVVGEVVKKFVSVLGGPGRLEGTEVKVISGRIGGTGVAGCKSTDTFAGVMSEIFPVLQKSSSQQTCSQFLQNKNFDFSTIKLFSD